LSGLPQFQEDAQPLFAQDHIAAITMG